MQNKTLSVLRQNYFPLILVSILNHYKFLKMSDPNSSYQPSTSQGDQSYNYQQQTGESNLFNQAPVQYGGFWERFAAALIDGIILWIVGLVLNMIFGTQVSFSGVSEGNALYSQYLSYYTSSNSFINLGVGWLYSALMESSAKQATIGKMAMNLKVTNLSGGRISFLQATGRHFGKILSTLILFIGYLMMIWDSKKQTLHDKLAGTLVIKK